MLCSERRWEGLLRGRWVSPREVWVVTAEGFSVADACTGVSGV